MTAIMGLKPEPAADPLGPSHLRRQDLGQVIAGGGLEITPGGGVGIDQAQRRIGDENGSRVAFGNGADRGKAARVAAPPERIAHQRQPGGGGKGGGGGQHAGPQHRLRAQKRGKSAGQCQRDQNPGAAQDAARPARLQPLCRRALGHLAPFRRSRHPVRDASEPVLVTGH